MLAAPRAVSAQDCTYTDALKVQWDQIKVYLDQGSRPDAGRPLLVQANAEDPQLWRANRPRSDASYGFCALAISDKAQSFGSAEKTLSKKADIQAALKAAFAYCDAAFSEARRSNGTGVSRSDGAAESRACDSCLQHPAQWEHYGNLVTYFRLKDMVPPSSQGGM